MGFVGTLLLLTVYLNLRARWVALPEWLLSVLDLVLINLPLAIAVIGGGIAASRVGIARATGIRSWRWIDLAYGLGVGLVIRAIVELVAPTTGTLGGPFGQPTLATTVVVVVGAVLISPFAEEWFFRGLVLRALVDGLSQGRASQIVGGAGVASVIAIVVSTFAFASLHFVPWGSNIAVSLAIGTFGVGLGCGILNAITGRLGAALIAHASFNAVGVVLLLG
ncbi:MULTISPECIES: CPBP family intramembrane glutamic endopeptidase [unclassified Microbacterium]|uniref:CPBP family intramembrane glutamic endopeptidase n=1 Tax=unclassified Microbacterium TaxID=2609290 RepID=UPI00214B0F2B|nr:MULTISPECIES: CPBP family intramembrane glutamic endopeptidase [unclassified Microbacterium]MCR2808910.1 CPBP family intramembrane metalloprotease [Microbacterium sp. zg.B185]WIM18671.1 CPBP family intramembrane metalloprotease [Microbacterium sp. zg-B185]